MRRNAAERFGVSISSAIRWRSPRRRTGELRPQRLGGDKRSARIEEQVLLILSLVEARGDTTLAELRSALAERGVAVEVSTSWRYFDRHQTTLKKDRACGRAVPRMF